MSPSILTDIQHQVVIYKHNTNDYIMSTTLTKPIYNNINIHFDKEEAITYITKLYYHNPEAEWKIMKPILQ